MKTNSVYPKSYIDVPSMSEEISETLITPLGSLCKKVFESAEVSAAIALAVTVTVLVVYAVAVVGESSVMTACYSDEIAKVVFTP